MRIVELILDEENDISGVDAISVVERPAIEEDFIALKEEIKFAEADKDQRILIGALLVPNKPIYRNGKDEDYYVYFSKETIKKTSELFLMNGYQNNSTLEHREPLQGLSLVESWIVEDDKKDKSRYYKMEVPVGTWMGAVKVNNEEVWNDFVKTGKVKGFSIEGYFADKMERPQESLKEHCKECDGSCGTCKKDFNAFYEDFVEEEAEGVVDELRRLLTGVELESFSDYPDAVKNNAKRGRELNEKQGNKCATETGKQRSADLAAGRPVTVDTIKRMYSYLSRAEEYYDEGNTEACGTISYLLWGGKAAKRWAESKLKELDLIDLKAPCQDGYEMIGMKEKNGRLVPNCVPIK